MGRPCPVTSLVYNDLKRRRVRQIFESMTEKAALKLSRMAMNLTVFSFLYGNSEFPMSDLLKGAILLKVIMP